MSTGNLVQLIGMSLCITHVLIPLGSVMLVLLIRYHPVITKLCSAILLAGTLFLSLPLLMRDTANILLASELDFRHYLVALYFVISVIGLPLIFVLTYRIAIAFIRERMKEN